MREGGREVAPLGQTGNTRGGVYLEQAGGRLTYRRSLTRKKPLRQCRAIVGVPCTSTVQQVNQHNDVIARDRSTPVRVVLIQGATGTDSIHNPPRCRWRLRYRSRQHQQVGNPRSHRYRSPRWVTVVQARTSIISLRCTRTVWESTYSVQVTDGGMPICPVLRSLEVQGRQVHESARQT